MDRGEIWHADLDPTQGHEIRGKRYVLVLSRADFNKVTGMALVCPVTLGGDFARDAGFAVSLIGSGTATQGVAVVNHVRVVDLKARKGKRVEKVPNFIVTEVLKRLQAIID